MKRLFIGLLSLTMLLVSGCSSNEDWNSSFVVWDDYIYVMSNEYVTDVESEIGKVTKYSDKEGTYFGNFSNTYKKGTKYFSIAEISTDEAIAVEENGKFIKAIRKGKYGKE